MLEKIGITLIMLGLAMGDSEELIVPVGIIALGTVLVWLGSRTEARHGKTKTEVHR